MRAFFRGPRQTTAWLGSCRRKEMDTTAKLLAAYTGVQAPDPDFEIVQLVADDPKTMRGAEGPHKSTSSNPTAYPWAAKV
mmetsp:Transcript_7948/g.15443  ORF Transcript_7948/g.15443 Transcript_7948/m.15443 type:complete len:80 (+) Transcript_7948:765-1004(+)|eukprot:scaffold768_cov166-Amphora_coffeaeformis.AAC.10